jgi:hypothetical protein
MVPFNLKKSVQYFRVRNFARIYFLMKSIDTATVQHEGICPIVLRSIHTSTATLITPYLNRKDGVTAVLLVLARDGPEAAKSLVLQPGV